MANDPQRVRIPSDRNLAAAARRIAVTPNGMLMRQFMTRIPDYVEFDIGTEMVVPQRLYFQQDGGEIVCFIKLRTYRNGVRLPNTGDVVTLYRPADFRAGKTMTPATYRVSVARVTPNFRVAILALLPL